MPQTQARSRHAKPRQRRRGAAGPALIRAGQYAGAVTAIVAAITAIVHFWPEPEPAPQNLNAEITDVAVIKDVAWRDFLAADGSLAATKQKLRAKGLSGDDVAGVLAVPGIEVDFSLLIEGPPGRELRLDAVVYRSPGRRRAPVSDLGATGRGFRSDAWRDRGTARTWVSAPTRPGRYYIELMLYDDKPTGPANAVASQKPAPFTY